jgi:LuxR family maltose regulon positive regulatory protein
VTYLATALDRVEPIMPVVLRTLAFSGAAITVVPLLASAIVSMREPVTVVLDDAEAITPQVHRRDHRARALLSDRITVRRRIEGHGVVAGFSAPPAGPHIEIGADDLAMSDREAAALLSGAGVDAGSHDINVLFQRTEGWPAGLYLAALAMRAGSPRTDAGFSVTR